MEKEFIPYMQALELKKLEFDEPCWGYFKPFAYWQIKDYKGDPSPWLKHDAGDHMYLKTVSDPFGNNLYRSDSFVRNSRFIKAIKNVSAPLFSQTFRWFRETYNLHNSFTRYKSSSVNREPNVFTHLYEIQIIDENTDKIFHVGDFNSPEEAELACLKKLIEIVKTGIPKTE